MTIMLQNGQLPQPETAFERVIYEYTIASRKILFEKYPSQFSGQFPGMFP